MHYLKCPNCGSRGDILVELIVVMVCENNGKTWFHDDYKHMEDPTENPLCECAECGYRGTESAFMTDEPCGEDNNDEDSDSRHPMPD